MPYTITTRWDGAAHPKPATPERPNPRAVATLDDARSIVWHAALDGYLVIDKQISNEAKRQYLAINESGGTVGPLPDGTVIEVSRVNYQTLAHKADVPHTDHGLTTAYIDAYNAAQS